MNASVDFWRFLARIFLTALRYSARIRARFFSSAAMRVCSVPICFCSDVTFPLASATFFLLSFISLSMRPRLAEVAAHGDVVFLDLLTCLLYLALCGLLTAAHIGRCLGAACAARPALARALARGVA